MLPPSITTLLKFEQSLTYECCVGFPTTRLSTDFHCQMIAKASFGRNPIYLKTIYTCLIVNCIEICVQVFDKEMVEECFMKKYC